MDLDEMRTSLVPFVCRDVEYLMQSKASVCAGVIQVKHPQTSCSFAGKSPLCDRFKLTIPYAGTTIIWEVLFDLNNPEEPPDFIFQEDDFFPDLENLKTLSEWDSADPSCLTRLLQELMVEYSHYQRCLIGENSRLSFEYSALQEECGLKPEDMEILVSKFEGKVGQVYFLIKMDVDFSTIPAYLTQDCPGEDMAVLLVCFSSPEGSRATTQLHLSPRVENALGGVKQLRIPPFPTGGCLTDYYPSVLELLKNKVDQVVKGYEKRKDYVAAFVSQFGSSLLEYNMTDFSKVSFLLERHDFYFTFHVQLPLYFPREQPVFVFQSIYHMCKGQPYRESFSDYPYSPRWSSQEMVERARSFILEKIRTFQRQSVLSGASSS